MEEGKSKYSEGKIYKIVAEGVEDAPYIGSTLKSLPQRLYEHRYSAKSNAKYKFASAPLFEEGNVVRMELVEAWPCETREQLLERERYWIQQYPDCINKNPPILDAEEREKRKRECLLRCYYAKHDERIEKQRAYKAANADALVKQQKEKRATIVECPICKIKLTYGALHNHKKRAHQPKPAEAS